MISYSTAFSACAKDEPRPRAVAPHVISYSTAISASAKGELRPRAVAPHVISYNAAISACVKDCERTNANSNGAGISARAWESDEESDLISYSAANSACEKRDGTENAKRYNAAISACSMKSDFWGQGLHLLHQVQLCRMQPDMITFSATMTTCEKS